MPLESQSPEHSITLPLVSKNDQYSRLPLVVDVLAKYWGEDLFNAVDRDQKGNQDDSNLMHGLELAESRGLVTYIYKGSVKDLKKRIDQGMPPIVIMPGIQGLLQHALVISGYNDDERRILTYVPEPDTVGAIPEAIFEEEWDQDEMTTILIIPADMKDLMQNENLIFKESNRLCFEAEALHQRSDINGATAKLLRATEIDQDNAQAWCLLGGVYNEVGDQRAVTCYESVFRLNPRYYLAYRGIGNYFLKRNDYALAESYYTNAIAINPKRFGPIYKNRAIARMQLGNKAGAKEDLIRYIEQTPFAQDRKDIESAISEL